MGLGLGERGPEDAADSGLKDQRSLKETALSEERAEKGGSAAGWGGRLGRGVSPTRSGHPGSFYQAPRITPSSERGSRRQREQLAGEEGEPCSHDSRRTKSTQRKEATASYSQEALTDPRGALWKQAATKPFTRASHLANRAEVLGGRHRIQACAPEGEADSGMPHARAWKRDRIRRSSSDCYLSSGTASCARAPRATPRNRAHYGEPPHLFNGLSTFSCR